MKEIEVKIMDVDKERVMNNLEMLGAKRIFKGRMRTLYYDFTDNRLEKRGDVLRIKEENGRVIISYKTHESKEKARIMNEYEVEVKNIDTIKEIFHKLGFILMYKVEKERISYMIGDVRFEIDEYPGLPVLLEIEAPDVEKIIDFSKKLGFSEEQLKPWSIRDVMNYYGVAGGGL